MNEKINQSMETNEMQQAKVKLYKLDWIALDQSWHPDSHMLVEVFFSFGESGHYDESLVYVLDHGADDYSVFASLDDLMGYLDNTNTFASDSYKLCELTIGEYEDIFL